MEQVDVLLRDLAAQLGTTIEHFWPMYVRYVMIMRVGELVSAFLVFLASASTAIAIKKWVLKRECDPRNDYHDLWWFGAIACWGIAVFAVLVFVSLIPGVISTIAAPEAAALKSLLSSAPQ